jgi:DNA gyrase/topoisomerase IV subunit A
VIKTVKLTEERGRLAGALVVPYEAEILLVTDTGTVIRMDLADVRPMGRHPGRVADAPGEGLVVASVVAVALVVEDEILGVVVQTGLVVFFAFLANLISDLTGGLRFTFADDRPDGAGRTTVTSSKGAASFSDDGSSTGGGVTSRDTGPRGAAAPTEERSTTRATTATTSAKGSDSDDPIFGDRGSSS